jgi:dynein intermediate chain 1, axonemal
MKSVRKPKNSEMNKTQSVQSLKADDTLPLTSDDWLPPKQLLKPLGQLQLSEKELEEEFTRILNANNPHAPQNISRYSNKELGFKTVANMDHSQVHFECDGYLVWNAMEEEGESEPIEDPQGDKKPLRNQFNYSERASQTVLFTSRSKSTNTEPPPQRSFSDTVTQFSIFDDYVEDQLLKKQQKEKPKKKEASDGVLPTESHVEEVYYRNTDLRKVMVVAERMANQNTFEDISLDYKYWDDASDELGDKKSMVF